jgi:hypothetical protein
MTLPPETTPTLPAAAPRKSWSAPKLESVDVAERTNKKTVLPSDGSGSQTIS